MAWVVVDGEHAHLEPATVVAEWQGNTLRIASTNVTALSFAFGPGESPFDPRQPVRVEVQSDGRPVESVVLGRPTSERSFAGALHRGAQGWVAGPAPADGLAKRHGLQGPIDDAFMDRFVLVRPTGEAQFPLVAAWAKSEMERAQKEWRRHYRGDAIVMDDTQVTDEELARSNVVLWGDPASNRLLARMLAKLPIEWTPDALKAHGKTHDPARHVPVLVFPNPLNPSRYVVLNSGFTFREYDYLNNARQTPKLPDWAVIDLRQAPNARTPGGIPAAGFFGEHWELR